MLGLCLGSMRCEFKKALRTAELAVHATAMGEFLQVGSLYRSNRIEFMLQLKAAQLLHPLKEMHSRQAAMGLPVCRGMLQLEPSTPPIKLT